MAVSLGGRCLACRWLIQYCQVQPLLETGTFQDSLWTLSEVWCFIFGFGNVFGLLDVNQMLLGSALAKTMDCANEFFGRSVKCPKHGRFISLTQFDHMCSSLSNPFLVNTKANLLQSCEIKILIMMPCMSIQCLLILTTYELSEFLQVQLLYITVVQAITQVWV